MQSRRLPFLTVLATILVALSLAVAFMVVAYLFGVEAGVEKGRQEFETSCLDHGEIIITYERHYICYLAHVDGNGA